MYQINDGRERSSIEGISRGCGKEASDATGSSCTFAPVPVRYGTSSCLRDRVGKLCLAWTWSPRRYWLFEEGFPNAAAWTLIRQDKGGSGCHGSIIADVGSC